MKYKPPSITVIALLQLVFGGVGIILGICGGVFLAAGGQNWFYQSSGSDPKQANIQKLTKELQTAAESGPAFQAVEVGSIGVDLAMSIAMIASGIGLLRLRPWARLLSIVYAFVSIGYKVFRIVYYLAFTIPAFNDFLNTHTANAPEEQMAFNMMRMTTYISPIAFLVFMIYPIIVLIIMFRPVVAAAFREGGSFQNEPDLERSRPGDSEEP